jgi:putative ABC transport system substrate-binding protein
MIVTARLTAIVALVLLLGTAPDALLAQSTRTFRVAHLSGAARTPDGNAAPPLRQALRELGYVEGQNVVYTARFAEGKADALPALAAEMVALKVDAIVAQGGMAVLAAKAATSTIPIVVAPASGDTVATGVIASLARPGGNITGLSDESIQLSAKRMELLKEAVPKAALIAVLWNVGDDGMTLRYREIEKAARILKVEVQALAIRDASDYASAFSAMTRRRPDAMFLVADPFTVMHRKQVLEFAAAQRIPAMYEFGSHVRDGGLMSYGPNPEDGFRRAATYLDRIFKGAKPGDLPAEQPTRYYFGINLKTAAALGLTIPQSVLLRADDVVQ